MTSEQKSLPEKVKELLAKKEESSHKAFVSEIKDKFTYYLAEHKDSKEKPADYQQVKKSLAHLKNAESEFSISSEDLYSSSAAQALAKKVIPWIKANTHEGDKIKELFSFQDKVNAAVKKKNQNAEPKEEKAPDDTLIKNILGALPDDFWSEEGYSKKELTEKLTAVADEVSSIGGKAVSGAVSTLIRGARHAKCALLKEDPPRKYNKT
jgi:hypothetical protein